VASLLLARHHTRGSFTDAGYTYDVYRSPPPYQCIVFVDRRDNLSGHVNLLNFFN
jgi:hypothetical protein